MTSSPKNLEITREGAGDAVCLHLSGVIDERFEARRLFGDLSPISILDLEGVSRITSFGVRQWSEAMKTLPSSVKHLYFVRCPPSFVDQLNMVLNFGGRAEVISATALYFCEKCQEERQVGIDVVGSRAELAAGQAVAAACPTCQSPLVLEDDPQQYFRFSQTYGAKSIDSAAMALLQESGLYQPKHVDRPPEEIKLVHGDVTMFCISGTLDARFRPRRLASGVEGEVVFDLRAVEGLDAEGASRWRKLLDELTAATLIAVVDLPEALVGPAAAGLFSLKGTVLYSVSARYHCVSCGNEMRESLLPAELTDSSSRTCSRCGKSAPLATDRATLRRLFQQSDVSTPIGPRLSRTIGDRVELISRARAESGGPQRSGGEGLSRYRVVRPLSQGGMAEILLAVHQGIGGFEKLIALKKIRREFLERRQIAIELFLNEAKIAANLNHPNIVHVFEVGEHAGDLYIAMEYVHGVDLRELLRAGIVQEKPLSTEQAIYIATQVAAALNYAHNARDLSGRNLKIVHRDVSLSNIVIGFDGQVKLVDFGIATASVVAEAQDGLVGKFSYMSPEQVRSEPLDGRSDVFSLGIVLYEMVARRTLFRRATDKETLEAVLSAPIPSLASLGVPAEIEQALVKALARQRDDRFADARAFEMALNDCLQQQKSTIDAHKLSLYMKDLFPAAASKPPVEGIQLPAQPVAASERDTPQRVDVSAPAFRRADDATQVDTSPGGLRLVNETAPSRPGVIKQQNASSSASPAPQPEPPEAIISFEESQPRTVEERPAALKPALPLWVILVVVAFVGGLVLLAITHML